MEDFAHKLYLTFKKWRVNSEKKQFFYKIQATVMVKSLSEDDQAEMRLKVIALGIFRQNKPWE